jgi:ribonuclease BN (tRNA processing enzyme)
LNNHTLASKQKNTIKFLGTAGSRFVVTRQIRKSGGIWISLDQTNILIDPGPGSLVRCLSSKPALNPADLDGIILTHKHIDHSNDINIIIEAMTNGGFRKKGTVFVPGDALDDDAVLLKYFRKNVEKIEILNSQGEYHIGSISFTTPVRHIHGVETYGLNIFGKDISISFITDTLYFSNLELYYPGDLLILYVVFLKTKNHIQHLSLEDAERIFSKNKPKLGIITHFGMNMVKAKPWKLAEDLSKKLDIQIIAASDGMEINPDDYIAKIDKS